MKKTISIFAALSLCIILLSGCNSAEYSVKQLKNAFYGMEATYMSYDEESGVVDKISSDQMYVSAEDTFAKVNSEGVSSASGVMSITIGKETIVHVGSSALIVQDDLVDVFDEYAKTYDINNTDTRGVPFLNKMVNSMKNLTVGQKYLILVRSQTGKPLATFVGNSVSYFKTPIDKSTSFLIDGKHLLIYRCDYTIVPLSFIK